MSQNPNQQFNLQRPTTSQISQNYQLPPNIFDKNPNLLKINNPQQSIQNNNTFPQQKVQGASSNIQIPPQQINLNQNISQMQPSDQFDQRQTIQYSRIQTQQSLNCPLCQQKQNQINDLNKKIKKHKSDYEELEEEFGKYKKKNQTLNVQDLQQQYQQDDSFEDESEELEAKLRNTQRKLKKITLEKNQEILQLNQKIEEYENQTKTFQSQVSDLGKQKQDFQSEKLMEIQKLNDMIKELNNQLQIEHQYKKSLESLLNEKQIEIQKLQESETKLSEQLANEAQYYKHRVDEIDKLKAQIKQLETYKIIDQKSRDSLQQRLAQKNEELTEIKANLTQKQDEIQSLKEINASLQGQKEVLQSITEKAQYNQNETWKQEMEAKVQHFQKLINSTEEKEKKKQLDLQKRKKEEEEVKLKQKLLIEELQKQQEQEKQAKINYAKNLKQKMKESHGSLEVCFVIDVTASMDHYKNTAMDSVKFCMKQIKEKTNRDTSFSTVCYQDFKEKEKLKNKEYQWYQLTKNTVEIETFLQSVKCSGGGDASEDIAGGLQQMCDQIKWSKPFRLAMLICDAPAHGTRFNGGCSDDHKDKGEDLIQAIKKMIKEEIILVALNFTQLTVKMYNEIQKIYMEEKRPDLFLLSDLSANPKNILDGMIQKMGEAAVQATHTNKKETKSKKDKPTEQKPNKDGAIEALCKTGNFFDFDKDPQVKIVQSNFKVYSVTLNDEKFMKDLTNLRNLKIPEDYKIVPEGSWNCIRTQSPFAFGMMKEVYLMKKANNAVQELYVIKTPLGGKTYESKEKAIEECRSHLICQSLMRTFMKDIRQACESKGKQMIYPTVIYTDFLILEENPNSFWIAERFFKGEFVKYNNNYGYISEDESILNQMAQAFSYYTYFKSNFNYMINDVQGVGTYFTDPAINTIEGKFDETDIGQDGQGMFMVSYDLRKGICAPIIKELLDIDDD